MIVPPEIWDHIFSFLPPPHQVRLLRVSKQWQRQLATNLSQCASRSKMILCGPVWDKVHPRRLKTFIGSTSSIVTTINYKDEPICYMFGVKEYRNIATEKSVRLSPRGVVNNTFRIRPQPFPMDTSESLQYYVPPTSSMWDSLQNFEGRCPNICFTFEFHRYGDNERPRMDQVAAWGVARISLFAITENTSCTICRAPVTEEIGLSNRYKASKLRYSK